MMDEIDEDELLLDSEAHLLVRFTGVRAPGSNPVEAALGRLVVFGVHGGRLFRLESGKFAPVVQTKDQARWWPETLAQIQRPEHTYEFGQLIDPKAFDAFIWFRSHCWSAGVRAFEKYERRAQRSARLRSAIEDQLARVRTQKVQLDFSATSLPLEAHLRAASTLALRPLRIGEFHARKVAARGEPLLHVQVNGGELIIAEVSYEGFDGYGAWPTRMGKLSKTASFISAAGVRNRTLDQGEAEGVLTGTRRSGFIAGSSHSEALAIAQQTVVRVQTHWDRLRRDPGLAAEHERLRRRVASLKARLEIVGSKNRQREKARLRRILSDLARVQSRALETAALPDLASSSERRWTAPPSMEAGLAARSQD